jgi:hypothetical protein
LIQLRKEIDAIKKRDWSKTKGAVDQKKEE